MLQDGPLMREHRRFAQAAFGPNAVKDYVHVQERCTVQLLQSLLDAPEDFYQQMRLYVLDGNVTMSHNTFLYQAQQDVRPSPLRMEYSSIVVTQRCCTQARTVKRGLTFPIVRYQLGDVGEQLRQGYNPWILPCRLHSHLCVLRASFLSS
jgi:hypothetical protein